MRTLADLQRGPDGDPRPTSTLPLAVTRRRTFDTPAFRGMTFHEVEAKTVLNRVKGMPFNWSINPYRGCSHACTYCLIGDTPILMADGRWKPLAGIAVGEEVYGTERRGAYRRWVTTTVLDHWTTVKPAFRVHLRDGTTLIASGHHRFLTSRGWKHVTGSEQGRDRRPHLTSNDRLIGVGSVTAEGLTGPKDVAAYERGYLCGMIRGDGHVGSYAYQRAGRSHGDVHRFRLALTDLEPLERTKDYLDHHGVPTTTFAFSAGTAVRQPLQAIRTSSHSGVDGVRALIAWPDRPGDDWTRGFLGGIFDAEGSYCDGVLRIDNTDPLILERIMTSLSAIGIPHVLEGPRANRCRSVRVTGGLREHLRFFHAVDPATTRKRTFEGRAVKGRYALEVEAVEPLGVDLVLHDITTGTGDFVADGVISHNCFARPTHRYLNLSPLEDFEREVVVKANCVEVLRHELRRPSWRREHVAMGTNTDPYQRAEGRYRLMPGIIDALAGEATPFSILTKGTLITRDVPALQAAAERVPVAAALTIGMLDNDLWRASEPGTPSPRARLAAVKRLNDAGIPTGIMLAPIMPGLNDDADALSALVDAAAAAGAVHISPIVLHLRPDVRPLFWPWLEREHPDLVPLYRRLYASGAGAAAEYRERVEELVRRQRRRAWQRHGRPAAASPPRGAATADARGTSVTADPTVPVRRDDGRPEQLSLL